MKLPIGFLVALLAILDPTRPISGRDLTRGEILAPGDAWADVQTPFPTPLEADPDMAFPTYVPVDDKNPAGFDRQLVIVQFSKRTSARLQRALRKNVPFAALPFPSSIGAINGAYGASELRPLLDPELASARSIKRALRTYRERSLRSPTGRRARFKDIPRVGDLFTLRLARNAAVTAAVAQYGGDPEVVYAEENKTAQLAFIPNDDVCTNDQYAWNMYKINAPCAWDASSGNNKIVAVIDSGLNLQHPDWVGASADVWMPRDYTDATPSTVDDLIGHGTHVSGIIRASTNNSTGMCSLAFNSTIMPIKAFAGLTSTTPILGQSLLWAFLNGADVVNLSWGGTGTNQTVELLTDFLYWAGAVVVTAAGNHAGQACEFYPTRVEHAITVSAFDIADQPAAFSNFGVKVDVAAPGKNIFSTCTQSGYCFDSGTSMAAPHVSALAALIVEQFPTLTNEQVKHVIRNAAVDVGSPGFDVASGNGRIDACLPLALTAAPPVASVTSPANCDTVSGVVSVQGLTKFVSGGSYALDFGAGQVPSSFTSITSGNSSPLTTLGVWDTSSQCDGDYVLRVVSSDSQGVSEDRNLVRVRHLQVDWPPAGADSCIRIGGPNPPDNVVVIPGVADCIGMTSYTLEYGSGTAPTTFSPILPVSTFTSQPSAGVLASWDISSVADGLYALRLTANCNCGASTAKVPVIVDKHLLPGWPADIDHLPTYKSPTIVDIDGGGAELVIGATVFNKDGTLKPNWTAFPGLGRTNSAVVELDNPPDGKLEVVAAVFSSWASNDLSAPNMGAPVVYAYEPDASIRWSLPLDNPNALSNHGVPSSVSAGDVDGDGKVDIVFSVVFSWNNPSQDTTVFVLDGATGIPKTAVPFTVPGASSSITLADLDGNNAEDLIISSRLPNNSGCALGAYDWDGVPLPGWSSPVTFACGAILDAVAADVDFDGHYEILVGNTLWNHDGTLTPGWPGLFQSRQTGAVADFDDGDPELEVIVGGLNHVRFWGTEHAGTPINQAPGTEFGEAATQIIQGENSIAGNVVIADVDGDPGLEILGPAGVGLADGCPPHPLYGSNRDLSSTRPPLFPRFVSEPHSRIRSTSAVGDLDGDGMTDVAVAGGGKVYVWRLGVPFDASRNPWPMFQHDAVHSGRISACNCCQITPQRLALTMTFPYQALGSVTCPTSDGIVSGAVSDPLGATACNLRAGVLYVGGGSAQPPFRSIIPDVATTVELQGCDPVTGNFSIGGLTSADTGSQSTCSAGGCFFGPPIPILVAADPSQSMCLVPSLDSAVSGSGNCNGDLSVDLPIRWDIYVTGDAAPGHPGTQPCPICTGTCQGGATPSAACDPAGSSFFDLFPTSYTCMPSGSPAATVLMPLTLTTGASEDESVDLTQAGVFCGFCADTAGGFTPQACASNSTCHPSTPVCRQRSGGAFGVTNARKIRQHGELPMACLGTVPYPTRLAGSFCIPSTFNPTIDAELDLPAPGAFALPVFAHIGP